MAQYQSSFEDADYGCGEVSKVTGEFTIEPISISHLPTDPTIARLTLSYTNKLTLSNVKYSTTTDQDVSAWMVLQSKVEALVSTDKTFVPRQDCTTTTNELSGQVEIAIKKDTSIQVGARWSGFDDNPDGLALPTLEWMELPLSDDFTLTPPQNLQVTFPDHPEGKIEATLESWSKNPNIGGVPVEGETWNWRVETVDENGDIIGVKEFNENTLTPTLFADTSKVKPNRAYQLKVIACNEYLLETAVISPTIYSLPPEPIIRRVTFYKTDDDKYTAVIDWAKPRSGGGYDEFVRLDVPGFVDDLEIAQVKNGASQTGSIEVPGLDPATSFVVRLSNTSLAGQRAVEQRFFTPSEMPTFKVEWDEPHRCVTVTAEAPNISEFELALGYYQGDESLGTTTGNTISACDLVHGEGQILYASAVPKLPDHTYTESTGFLTTPILNPILGVSKNCNVSLNIVDIVESKQGVATKKWQTGERIKVVEPCPPPAPDSALFFTLSALSSNIYDWFISVPPSSPLYANFSVGEFVQLPGDTSCNWWGGVMWGTQTNNLRNYGQQGFSYSSPRTYLWIYVNNPRGNIVQSDILGYFVGIFDYNERTLTIGGIEDLPESNKDGDTVRCQHWSGAILTTDKQMVLYDSTTQKQLKRGDIIRP